ncbi:hypothetical protein [Mucilaginibacter conchicola]|nr:hypothetical protein [Mucilaginibacter conchicola]
MKTVWLSIKQHPIPAFCYLFYLFICYGAINNSAYLSRQMKLHPDRGGIANGGEAAALTGGLTYFAGFILLLVCIIRGSSKNGDSNFYLWFALAIIIPMVVAGNASEFVK